MAYKDPFAEFDDEKDPFAEFDTPAIDEQPRDVAPISLTDEARVEQQYPEKQFPEMYGDREPSGEPSQLDGITPVPDVEPEGSTPYEDPFAEFEEVPPAVETPEGIAVPADEDDGNFVAGVKRGTQGLQATAYGAMGLLGQAVGADDLRDWGFEGYTRNIKEAGKHEAKVENFTDIDWGSLDSISSWIAGSAGELVPSIVESIVTAGIGTAVGGAAGVGVGALPGAIAGAGGKAGIKKLLRNRVAKYMKSEAGKKIAKEQGREAARKAANKAVGASIGGALGVITGTAIPEGGGMWGEDATLHGVENANWLSAAGLGTVSGVSEVMAPGGHFARKLFTKGANNWLEEVGKSAGKNVFKRLGIEVPKNIAGEFGQEAFQEFLGQINSKITDLTGDVSLTDKEALVGYFNAGMKGAVGGGFFGGVTALTTPGPLSKSTGEQGVETKGPEGPVSADQVAMVISQIEDNAGDPNQTEEQMATEDAAIKNALETLLNHGELSPEGRQLLMENQDLLDAYGVQQKGTVETALDTAVPTEEEVQPEQPASPTEINPKTRATEALATTPGLEGVDTEAVHQSVIKQIAQGKVPTDPTELVYFDAYHAAVSEHKQLSEQRAKQAAEIAEFEGVAPEPTTEVKDEGVTGATDKEKTYPDQRITEGEPVAGERARGPVPSDTGTRAEKAEVSAPARAEKAVKTKSSVVAGQEVETEPTPDQKAAGNYKKGHRNLDGMGISIENPAGSTRSGVDETGRKWSQKMANDYGYIKGSVGYDKDQIDVFFEKNYDGGAKDVYIVNQHAKDGTFDEHKVVIGAADSADAKRIYDSNYEKGWTGGKSVVKMPMDEFKAWVRSGQAKKGPATETTAATRFKEESEKVLGKVKVMGVVALINARASALGMTGDQYIASRGIELKTDGLIAGGALITPAMRRENKGLVDLTHEGRAIIHAFEGADISTVVHELGHIFRRDLSPAQRKIADRWVGAKPGEAWTVEQEEKFARGWEQYLASGKAEGRGMTKVFERMTRWMINVYQSLHHPDIDVEITPEVKEMFDSLLSSGVDPKVLAQSDIQAIATSILPGLKYQGKDFAGLHHFMPTKGPTIGQSFSTMTPDRGSIIAAMDVVNAGFDKTDTRVLKQVRSAIEEAAAAENITSVTVGARPGEFGWSASDPRWHQDKANFPYTKSSDEVKKMPPAERKAYRARLAQHEDAQLYPPIQHPVQGKPRLKQISRAMSSMLNKVGARKLIAELTGVKDLQISPIEGTWLQAPEPSFNISSEGMTVEQAGKVSNLLGWAFAQDSVVVSEATKGLEEGIPTLFIGSNKKLTRAQLNAILRESKKHKLDFSTTKDGRGVKYLYFGEDAGLSQFYENVLSIKDTVTLPLAHSTFSKGDLNESETYLKESAGSIGQAIRGDSRTKEPSDFFRRSVDNLIVPYAKAVAGEGYRFSPERFGERFGHTKAEVEYIRKKLRPASGVKRSTSKILSGKEKLKVDGKKTKSGEFIASVSAVMWALQNRAGKLGLIEPGDHSPHAQRIISDAIADEVIYNINSGGKEAVGWYDAALAKAKRIYYDIFPELQTDQDAETMFTAILGITSQGADVHTNSKNAVRVYDMWRDTKTMAPALKKYKGTFGKETKAVQNNLIKLQGLIEARGFAEMREIWGTRKTISEWRKDLRQKKIQTPKGSKKIDFTGAAEQPVTGWYMFGPKIGSFINNLHGDYSTLTADLWYTRTWNRLLGYNFVHTDPKEVSQYQRFKEEIIAEYDAISGLSTDPDADPGQHDVDTLGNNEQLERLLGDPDAMLALAYELNDRYKKSKYKDKSELRKGAKNWVEGRDAPAAAPRGVAERYFQQLTMERAQKKVKKQAGVDITIADMQAALWYHEKELFSHLGAKNERAEPADYADAANAAKREVGVLAQSQGLHHYSSVEGLTHLDPSYYGKGIKGAEGKRKANDPKNWVDRTYYALDGGNYRKEPGLGNKVYRTTVPMDRLYDMNSDPDQLIPKAQSEKRQDPFVETMNVFEKLVKGAGYLGYTSRSMGGTAAIFETLPVRQDPGVMYQHEHGRKTTDFFSAVTRGKTDKYKPDVSRYTPVMALTPKTEAFNTERDKYQGHFDEHILTSIPSFNEIQAAKGQALVDMFPDGATMLDIGASEGSTIKAIGARSGNKITGVALDPNQAMRYTFNRKPQVKGVEFEFSAFVGKDAFGVELWTEPKESRRGREIKGETVSIKGFDPGKKRFDIVHESMVFQFIDNNRAEHLDNVMDVMAPDGIAVFEEKFTQEPVVQKENEDKKDEWKLNFYTIEQLSKKEKDVLGRKMKEDEEAAVGMQGNQVSTDVFENELFNRFDHVVQYWDSGNFRGYAASNDKAKIDSFVRNLEIVPHEFETRSMPRMVDRPHHIVEDESSVLFQERTKPAPTKTVKSYKLFRVIDGKGYPLFIDRAAPIEIGKWYDAKSPIIKDVEHLEPGKTYLVDKNGNITPQEFTNKKQSPSKKLLDQAALDGSRYIYVGQYANGEKSYHNWGINGSGGVSSFAMRPGWHSTNIPAARHIGKQGPDRKPAYRRAGEYWAEIEVSADKDYNPEASKRQSKDIPERIPEDGWYSFRTNTAAEQAQDWLIGGSIKINRFLTDAEAAEIAEAAGFEKDLPREPDVLFQQATTSIGDQLARTIETTENENLRKLGKYLQAMIPESKLNIPVVIDPEAKTPNYNIKTGVVTLRSPGQGRVSVHEITHSVTAAEMQKNTAMRERVVELMELARETAVKRGVLSKEDIEKIRTAKTSKKFREQFSHLGTGGHGQLAYGLLNEYEFLSQAMSSPGFQKLLKVTKVKPKGKIRSAWDAFVDMVMKSFGIEGVSNNAFGAALNSIAELAQYEQIGQGDPNVLAQPAFHGTPHRGIEQFSTDKIGTGEGHQAYGWGLYFADAMGVAEFYRKNLAVFRGDVRYKGEKINPSNAEATISDPTEALALSQLLSTSRDVPEARKILVDKANDMTNLADFKDEFDVGFFYTREEIDQYRQAAEMLEEVDSNLDAPTGQLYKVEVPEDDTMFLHDKYYKDQPRKVKKALDDIGKDIERIVRKDATFKENKNSLVPQTRWNAEYKYPSHNIISSGYGATKEAAIQNVVDGIIKNSTGGSVYRDLSKIYGSDKAVSELLNKNGVKGIKYLDRGSRGAEKQSFNYVIFDGADVAITDVLYQQETRQTSNPKATIDGQQSDATPEAGAEIILNIMRKLKAASTPAVVRKKFTDDETTKVIKGYLEAIDVVGDPLKTAKEKQDFLAKFSFKIPLEARGKLLKPLTSILSVKTGPAQNKRVAKYLERANKELSFYLARQFKEKIKKGIKPLKKKKGLQRGRGWRYERDMAYIRDNAILFDRDDIESEIASQQARIASKNELLQDPATTPRGRQRALEAIGDAESRIVMADMFGDMQNKSFEEVLASYHALTDMIQNGRAQWRAVKEARKADLEQKRLLAARDITGEFAPQPETVAQSRRRERQQRKLWPKFKELMSTVENSIQSWELALDKISANAKAGTLKSWLVTHFSSIYQYANRHFEQMQLDTNEIIQNKAMEIFGKKTSFALGREFAKLDDNPMQGKIFIHNGGARQEVLLTQMEAAYWYLLGKGHLKGDKALDDTFDSMGVDTETLDQIDAALDPKVKEWADWIQQDFLDNFHDGINVVYRQVEGIELTKTKDYIPRHRVVSGKVEDKQREGSLEGSNVGSTKKGGLHQRVYSTNHFKVMNLNDVLSKHVTDMNHYKAWAIPSQEINGVFNSPEIQGYIKQHYGPSSARMIRFFQERFTQTPGEGTDEMQWIDKWRGKIATYMVGINPVVFLKQLTSIPAFAADIPAATWAKHTSAAMLNPKKAWDTVKDSPILTARLKQGYERDIATAHRVSGSSRFAGLSSIPAKAMVLTKLGDAAAIVIGGYAVYKHHYDLAKANGATSTAAREKAIKAFEASFQRSQQSGSPGDLGWFLQGTPMQRLFTLFMTSPASYSRQVFTAIRHMKDDPVDSLKRLTIYGVILPITFQMVADALLVASDDDEDRDRALQHLLKAVATGPFNGLPIIRTLTSGAWEAATGNQFLMDQSFSPITELAKTPTKAIFYAGKGFRDDSKWFERMWEELFNTAGIMTGVPTENVLRIWDGWDTALKGDTSHPLARFLGYSAYAVNEKR